MKSEASTPIRLAVTDAVRTTPPEDARQPRIAAGYGFLLAGLSGRIGLDGPVNSAEMLSPVLAGLAPDEHLAIEISRRTNSPSITVGLRGDARGTTPDAARQRQEFLVALLRALGRGQLPGFVLRPLEAHELAAPTLPEVLELNPRGRRIRAERGGQREAATGSGPGPALVDGRADGVLLPALEFSPERLTSLIEVLRAGNDDVVLSLEMRVRRFDAAALRQLAAAREAAAGGDARTNVEAVRQLAVAMPDDALMTAFLNDGSGVELALVVRSARPLDEATRRMLCHAVFGVEPAAEGHSASLDLSRVFPRAFVLPRAIAGLAACAALAVRRAPDTYEPPAGGGLLLGSTADGRPVQLTQADRAMHQFVCGGTGTGKSTLLLNQIVADMREGRGLIVLDPHGDLWEAARRLVPANRRKDVILAHLGDPQYTFSMNVLAGLGGDPDVERSATANGLIRLWKNSMWSDVKEAFGPMFEMYFRNALLLLMAAEGADATILDFERIFQDEGYRNRLISRCNTPQVADFWHKTAERVTYSEISLHNVAPYIVCKFAPFTTNKLLAPILGSKTSSLDLQKAIAKGKIVLVNLAKGVVGEGSARLVGALITMRLVAAAQTQMQLPEDKRREFVAYLDEFQSYATEHVAEAIDETRKYKLRMVLACQSLGQIDGRHGRSDVGRSIVANVANLVAFRLGVEDAAALARYFEPGFKAEDLMYLPNHMAVARILASGQAIRPFELKTQPPPAAIV